MDIDYVQNAPGNSAGNSKSRRKKRKAKKKTFDPNGPQIETQPVSNFKDSNKISNIEVANDAMEMSTSEKDSAAQPPEEEAIVDTGCIKDPSEVNKSGKKKKNRKKVKNKIEVNKSGTSEKDSDAQPGEEANIDTGSIKDSSEVNKSGKKKKKRKKVKNKTKGMDPMQNMESMDQNNMDTGSCKNHPDGNENKKRKRKMKRKKNTIMEVEVQSVKRADAVVNLTPGENHTPGANGELTATVSIAEQSELSVKINNDPCSVDHNVNTSSSSSYLAHSEVNIVDLYDHVQNISAIVEVPIKMSSFECVEDGSRPLTCPMELEARSFPCESQHRPNPIQMSEENEKIENEVDVGKKFVDPGKFSSGGIASYAACNDEVVSQLPHDRSEAEFLSEDSGQYSRIRAIASRSRKLLVLDVNGLLASIVMPAPKDRRGDIHILGRAIFRRPFCDDFLKFCFHNFDVGVWSSRSKRVIDKVVDYLLGDLKDKLLFCWDMIQSTQTGFKTLENCHKPLVCKELSKIWDNQDPNLPWKKGDYDESNTLLLDDSPYKALLNPLNTAIFPVSYHYEDKDDSSLGPGGDLRVYLEGLLACDNVQKYVEQHPFGQGALNETSSSWGFYSGVLQTMVNRSQDNTPPPLPTLS